MVRRSLAAAAVALLIAAGCSSGDGTVEVRGAWARDTAPGQTSAALYFTVANPTDRAFRITGVTVPRTTARRTSLHRSMTSGGAGHDMASMRPITTVPVAAHSTLRFEPGGLHVMMEGVRQPLKVRDRFTMTLRRSEGAPLRTEVRVKAA